MICCSQVSDPESKNNKISKEKSKRAKKSQENNFTQDHKYIAF